MSTPPSESPSNPHEWTDEQREALDRWRDKDPAERHPHDLLPEGRRSDDDGDETGEVYGVTDEECGEMRRLYKDTDDLTIKAMSEDHFSYSRTTIAEHVFDRRCSHDIIEDPAVPPSETGSRPSKFVTPGECAEMRETYHDGSEIPEVQAEYGTSYAQAYHHLAGRCRCDHEIEDIHGQTTEERHGD